MADLNLAGSGDESAAEKPKKPRVPTFSGLRGGITSQGKPAKLDPLTEPSLEYRSQIDIDNDPSQDYNPTKGKEPSSVKRKVDWKKMNNSLAPKTDQKSPAKEDVLKSVDFLREQRMKREQDEKDGVVPKRLSEIQKLDKIISNPNISE